ncbi:hypothetical protein [Actinoplanes sp. NPDC023714]|uniref:hypothetical protein n=1 Tax=Actinoplanes sp. NPDC023714 TaxID=3154322 RepID=UPI0033F2F8FD
MSQWPIAILPALVALRWAVLWRRTRRERLRFAWLAPTGALAGVLVGLCAVGSSLDRRSCFGDDCRGDVAHFTSSLDASAGLGTLILISSALALLTAAVLAVTTLVVETVLMVRRHERGDAGQGNVTT